MAAFGTWTGFDTAGLWDAGTGGFDAAGVSPFQPTPSTPYTQKETASAELESLLPSLFEFPVGPPPLATIDAEMGDEGLSYGSPSSSPSWSSFYLDPVLRFTPTSSPPTLRLQAADDSHLVSLPLLVSEPKPAALPPLSAAAAVEPAAVDVLPIVFPHHFEDGSSSEDWTPTSPISISGGTFSEDSTCSSERQDDEAIPRPLVPSPSVIKQATMVAATAKATPGRSKTPASTGVSVQVDNDTQPPTRSPVAAGAKATASTPASETPARTVPPPRKRRKATFSKPVPSRFCHLCSRTTPAVRHIVCGALVTSSTCRKVVCDRCFTNAGTAGINGATWDEAVAAGPAWRCCHCVGNCPDRAQCRNYTRTNERLRLMRSATGPGAGRGTTLRAPAARRRVRAKPAAADSDAAEPRQVKRKRGRLSPAVSCPALGDTIAMGRVMTSSRSTGDLGAHLQPPAAPTTALKPVQVDTHSCVGVKVGSAAVEARCQTVCRRLF